MSSSDEEFELNYGVDDEVEENFVNAFNNLEEEYDAKLDDDKYEMQSVNIPKYENNPKIKKLEQEKDNEEEKENDSEDTDAPLEDLLNLIQQEDDQEPEEEQKEDKLDQTQTTKKFIIKKDNLSKQKTSETQPQNITSPTQASKPISGLSKTPKDEEAILKEKNSGLRIIKSTFKSELELNMHLNCDYGKYIKLTDLSRRMVELKDSKDMDWFSIFVVGSKTESKCSAKGNNYVVWQIYDLNNLERQQEISLFLFGGAYKSHWKSSEFDCFAIIKPEFLESNKPASSAPTNQQSNYFNPNQPLLAKKGAKSDWNKFATKKVSQNLKLTLSVKSDGQLVRLGIAKDISYCQSYVKSNPNQQETNKKCKNLVNLEQAPFCVYHCVQKDKNNQKNKYAMNKPMMNRFGNQNLGFSSPSSTDVKFLAPNQMYSSLNKYSDLEQKAKVAKELKSEILRSLNSSITKESPALSNIVYKTNKKSDLEVLASLEGKHLEKEEIKQIRLAEQATVRHLTGQNDAPSKELRALFNSKLLLPNENNITSISSQKLVDLKKSNSNSIISNLPNSSRLKEKLDENKKNFSLSTMSHKDILKEVKQKTNTESNKPEINLNEKPPEVVKDSSEKIQVSDFLKKRITEIKKFTKPSEQVKPKETQIVNKTSGFDLELFIGDSVTTQKLMDVGSKYIPHSPSTATSESYKRKLQEMSPSSAKKEEKETVVDKREKRLKLIEELQGIKSTHAKEASDPDKNPHLRAYYNKLEQQEKIDEKLCNLRNREVRVVTCKVCDYTTFTQSDFCKSKKHEIKRHMVLQRFFKCKSCGKRTYTLDKVCPVTACYHCGNQKYEPCTMKDDNSKDVVIDKTSKLDEESEMYFDNEKVE